MDSTVIAAIIGAAGTVIAPILTFMVTRHVDHLDKQAITFGQRAAISGKWEGTMSQENGEYSGVYPMVLTAGVKGKIVKGNFHVRYPESSNRPPQEDESTFQGGFLHNQFLQLDYILTNKRRIQFGSIVLELSSSGEVLSGRYVGYGAFSEQVVSGKIDLSRTA